MTERDNLAKAVPRTVWALGLVSLCMDVSSEMIHALLPIYHCPVNLHILDYRRYEDFRHRNRAKNRVD